MKHVHLIGIGGTGLSAIARVLLESGYIVSGSDRLYSSLVESVQEAGAKFYLGHKSGNVTGADIVVRSSAVADENEEVIAANSNGIPVLKRDAFLGQLLHGKQGIAIAGTHGKTTTTAMIAWTLIQLEQDPSFIVGGVISGLGTNARAGSGPSFVIEADEYDHMFLGLNPQIAVITNIEHDHPDCYPTPDDFRGAFREFVGRLTPDGTLVACGDDLDTSDVLAAAEEQGNRALTYGIKSPTNYYQATLLNPNLERGGYDFQFNIKGESVSSVSLQVPGLHNVKNALAALAVADQLGLPISQAAQAASSFRGIERRFEIVGDAGGVKVISDYAHHPTEIKATLSAAISQYPGRKIWAVWQPHTYSRTKMLFDEFVKSFDDAHHVLVTEVYASREPIDPVFSSKQVVDAMAKSNTCFISEALGVVNHLFSNLKPGDVLIVLSAGDGDQICKKVLSNLSTLGKGDKND